jgi:hypothetical protein
VEDFNLKSDVNYQAALNQKGLKLPGLNQELTPLIADSSTTLKQTIDIDILFNVP